MLKLYERYNADPSLLEQNNSYLACFASWMMKNALNHESALYAKRVTDLNPEFCEVPYLQAFFPRPEPEAVRSEVRDIAGQLPEEHQAVYTRLVEGYDLEEIGEALGISKFKASRVKQEMIHAISLAYQLPRDRRQLMIRELYR
jgi:DNA-directed RNA polymerase specialized sigma24 family protein